MTLQQLTKVLTAAAEALEEMEHQGPASTDLAVAAMHIDLAVKHLQASEANGKTLYEIFAREGMA
jgi:hypothetical protein